MARHARHIKQGIGQVFISRKEVAIPNLPFTHFENHNDAVRPEQTVTIFLEGLDIFMAGR